MTRNDSIDLFTGQGLDLIEVNPLKLNHSAHKAHCADSSQINALSPIEARP